MGGREVHFLRLHSHAPACPESEMHNQKKIPTGMDTRRRGRTKASRRRVGKAQTRGNQVAGMMENQVAGMKGNGRRQTGDHIIKVQGVKQKPTTPNEVRKIILQVVLAPGVFLF